MISKSFLAISVGGGQFRTLFFWVLVHKEMSNICLFQDEELSGPMDDRSCTDVIFFILFAAFMVGMVRTREIIGAPLYLEWPK